MISRPKRRQLRARASLSGLRIPVPAFLRAMLRGGAEALRTRFLLAISFIFLFGAAAAMHFIDGEETTQLAWALILLIAVSSMVRIVPAADAIATVLSIGTYGGIQLVRTIKGGNYFPQIFAGMACFALAAWITRAAAQRLQADEDEMMRMSILLDEVTMRDTITGVMKSPHAQRLLTDEIQRSRRYAHSLTLLIVGIDDWETIVNDKGPQMATELSVRLAGIVAKSVRVNIDTVSRHGQSRFVAILPETPLEGARVVAERMVLKTREELNLNARVGIAEFPADALTSEDLITEAVEALEFARAAELRVADRKILT